MRKRKRFFDRTVRLLTGKYGILLLTALNACLACLVIALSNFLSQLDLVHSNTDFMTFFLPDYRIGFISRALVGSVIYLFTKHPTVRMVSVILYVTILISSVLFCRMQASLAKKALLASDYATLLLSYLFFLNALFWCNSVEEIGLLDIFMTLLVQLFLLIIERSRTLGCILAPLVCFLGLLIHTAFFFYGFPIAAAILWYELLQRGKPDRVCAAFFAVTCVVAAALFLMFTVIPQDFVRVSPDELMAMLREKYDGQIQDTYFVSHLFRTNGEEYSDTISASGFLDYAGVGTNYFSDKVIRLFLDVLPLSALLYIACISHARRSGNRLIAYLGFLAPLVCLFPSLHFSTDKERFCSLCVLAEYMLLHYVSTQSDVRVLPAADDLPQKKMSAYASKQRREKYNRTLIVCAVAGLVFTAIAIWDM